MNLIEIRHELQKHEKNKVILLYKALMDVSDMWEHAHDRVFKIAVAHF
jgi:hypothetical protein